MDPFVHGMEIIEVQRSQTPKTDLSRGPGLFGREKKGPPRKPPPKKATDANMATKETYAIDIQHAEKRKAHVSVQCPARNGPAGVLNPEKKRVEKKSGKKENGRKERGIR